MKSLISFTFLIAFFLSLHCFMHFLITVLSSTSCFKFDKNYQFILSLFMQVYEFSEKCLKKRISLSLYTSSNLCLQFGYVCMRKAVYFKDDSFLASVHPIKNNIALFQLQAVIYKRENYTFIFEISQLELVII